MTRISKQQERRSQSPRKNRKPSLVKTGPKKDNLPKGFKEHANSLEGTAFALTTFVPKIK